MCHYRHRAHADPFYLPGLQDITAHVDFTAVVEAGHAAGLDFLGYTTQGVFLLNCGLTEVLARTPYEDRAHYLPLAASAQKLLGPSEMGELFKVMALGKGIEDTLLGFARATAARPCRKAQGRPRRLQSPTIRLTALPCADWERKAPWTSPPSPPASVPHSKRVPATPSPSRCCAKRSTFRRRMRNS